MKSYSQQSHPSCHLSATDSKPVCCFIVRVIGVALDPAKLCLGSKCIPLSNLSQNSLNQIPVHNRLLQGCLPFITLPVLIPYSHTVDAVSAVCEDVSVLFRRGYF